MLSLSLCVCFVIQEVKYNRNNFMRSYTIGCDSVRLSYGTPLFSKMEIGDTKMSF